MPDIIKTSKVKSKGFGLIPKLVMQDNSLHISAKAIYAYFCSFTGGGDTCFPSRNKICIDLGISKDTYSRYLKQLILRGYIEVEQIKQNGKFSHNVYTICEDMPEITVSENFVHDKSVHDGTVSENTVYGKIAPNINNINNKNIYSSNEEYIQKDKLFAPNAEEVKNEFEDAETAQSNTLTSEQREEQIKINIDKHRERYNIEQLKIIDTFFDILKHTRRSCRMAGNVILKIYESWEKYEIQKVIYALEKYINNPNLHDKKENYVLGIIRNTTLTEINKAPKREKTKTQSFCNYEQRIWDFESINKLKNKESNRKDTSCNASQKLKDFLQNKRKS